MMNGHVTEEDIQAMLWDPEEIDPSARLHISSCDHCRSRVVDYQRLFKAIEILPEPVFDFNVSDLVLTHIVKQRRIEKSPNTNNIWLWIALVLMLIGLTGTPFLLFRESFYEIIAGISTIVIYLIILIVVLVAGFLAFDEYRKYKQQINSLNL